MKRSDPLKIQREKKAQQFVQAEMLQAKNAYIGTKSNWQKPGKINQFNQIYFFPFFQIVCFTQFDRIYLFLHIFLDST